MKTKAILTQVVNREFLTVPDADNVTAETTLQLPAVARITAVNFHHKGVEVFFLKTLPAADVARKFLVARTGAEVPHHGVAQFVATVTFPKTPALHVFELL